MLSMNKKRGQITLPFVLLIGGIIVEIAIAGSFVTYFLSSSGYGERLGNRANAAAQSGAWDAMVKISQNKEFSSASCGLPYSYSVTVGSDSAVVSVCRTTNSSLNAYVYTLTAVGTAVSRQKKLIATLIVDVTTGRLRLESTVEQAVE